MHKFDPKEAKVFIAGKKIEPLTCAPDCFEIDGDFVEGEWRQARVNTDAAHGHTETEIRDLTDTEALALGLHADVAASVSFEELQALIGEDLTQVIAQRAASKLPAHIQMIAARVALEQGLDPLCCLDDLDATLERMGHDADFKASIEALGRRMGAPKAGHAVDAQQRRAEPNRHERRAARAQARRAK